MDEPADPGVARSREQVARAVDHDPLERSHAGPAGSQRDGRSCRPLRLRGAGSCIRDVALGELAAPAGQLRGLTRIPDEAAHGQVAAAQLVDDVATHEAGAPRDEDQPAVSFWKFCQYLDGVGPRCPWYFEPIPPVPYGVSAASVSWTNEIWPIFISG